MHSSNQGKVKNMAEGTIGIPGGVLPAMLALTGVLLAPVIAAIANFLSRPSLQRRQQVLDYKKSQLDLIDKALTVGKSVSDTLGVQIDVSAVEIEYHRILSSLSEPEPTDDMVMVGRRAAIVAFSAFLKRPWFFRLLWLPRPQSFGAWVATSAYYVLMLYWIMFIGTIVVPLLTTNRPAYIPATSKALLLVFLVVFPLMAYAARYVAVVKARSAALVLEGET
jgi:hypothetical protein